MGVFFKELFRRLKTLRKKDTIDKMNQCDILLMCQDVDRGDIKNGLPYSKLIDSIHEDLILQGFSCQQLVLPPYSSISGEAAWGRPYSANRSFFLAWIISVLKDKIGLAESKMNLFPTEEVVFSRVLKIANPSIVFVIGAQPPLCRAARKQHILVVEVLHGIGYDSVKWGWESEPVANLPSVILSLDTISTSAFSKLETKGVIVREIPHPWYKRFKSGALNAENLDQDWIKRPKFLPHNKKIVLLSLVWGYDGDHGHYSYFANILRNGLFPDELAEVIKQTSDDIFWCIRRHPVQVRDAKYDYQTSFLNEFVKEHPNSEWEESTSFSLISLFNTVSAHITMISMTSYDSALLGIKTLLLCPTLHNGKENEFLFADLEKTGYAVKSSLDVSFIYNWVLNTNKTSNYTLTNVTEIDWHNLVFDMYNRKNEFRNFFEEENRG